MGKGRVRLGNADGEVERTKVVTSERETKRNRRKTTRSRGNAENRNGKEREPDEK